MIEHKINIGDVIYDDCNGEWGIVCAIHAVGNGISSLLLTNEMGDTIIGYTPCYFVGGECIECHGYSETTADNAYPHIADKYFWGCDVCLEINADEFDEEHDYDYYCPERNENCWEFEVA